MSTPIQNTIIFSDGLTFSKSLLGNTGFIHNLAINTYGIYKGKEFAIKEYVDSFIMARSNGYTGSQGPNGDSGLQGDDGLQGPTGQKGDNGSKGDDGLQGPTGQKGDNGSKGDDGLQGPTGSTGDDGAQGIQGITGLTGPQGLQGEVGKIGPPTSLLTTNLNTNTTMYPIFSLGTGFGQTAYVGPLSYNPSTNTLTSTIFDGSASNVNLNEDTSTATSCYIPFSGTTHANGNALYIEANTDVLSYVPSTGTLTTGILQSMVKRKITAPTTYPLNVDIVNASALVFIMDNINGAEFILPDSTFLSDGYSFIFVHIVQSISNAKIIAGNGTVIYTVENIPVGPAGITMTGRAKFTYYNGGWYISYH